jgi:hypothetical protein
MASVYDPSSRMFGGTGNMTVIRVYHTATLLPDGTVLIAGGDDGPDFNITANSTELYDPTGQTFTGAADMISARELHTATLLNNGKVLITGTDAISSTTGAALLEPGPYSWFFFKAA